MSCWWTCHLCGDRMAQQTDPRNVERDRDAHLRDRHAGQQIEPRALMVSWWGVAGEERLVRV